MVEWFRSSKEIGHSIPDVEFWHNKGKCELLRCKKIWRKKKKKRIDKGLLYLSSSLNVGRFWLSISFHFNELKIVTRKNINANSRSNFTIIIPVSELITFFFLVILSWILNSNLWFENIQWLKHKIIMCYIGFHM